MINEFKIAASQMENPAEGLACTTEMKAAELQLQSRKPCKRELLEALKQL